MKFSKIFEIRHPIYKDLERSKYCIIVVEHMISKSIEFPLSYSSSSCTVSCACHYITDVLAHHSSEFSGLDKLHTVGVSKMFRPHVVGPEARVEKV